MIYENNGFYVDPDSHGCFVVFRPAKSGAYAETDSRYPSGIDGLSLAICRAMHLASGPARGQASAAMALAQEYMKKAKSRAHTMASALAGFDAEFGMK